MLFTRLRFRLKFGRCYFKFFFVTFWAMFMWKPQKSMLKQILK